MSFVFLIVDDEKLSRNYMRNMISQYAADATILEAASAKQALPLLEEKAIDILFLDIKMSGTNGFGLLDMISHRNFELVFITAYNQFAIQAIKEGAADYLLKPVKKSDFKETLLKVVARRREKLQQSQNNELFRSELARAEQKLQAYITNVREKNELIEQLNTEIELLQARNGVVGDKPLVLDKLQKNTILTEEDWQHFKEIFETVFDNFFARLKEKYSNLTQAEIRLLALTKLNLSTREMAAMLGISPETIRQTRWRLRKKIDLPEEQSLEEIVAAL